MSKPRHSVPPAHHSREGEDPTTFASTTIASTDEPWARAKLGALFNIGAGKSVTPAARNGEPKFPFLRTSNVFWGRIDITDVDAMFFSPGEIEAKSLRPGDLLVCEGGDIGRSAIWNGELEACAFQNHLHRLRPKRSDVVPRFFMYYLQSGFSQLGIYEGAGNKTTIPNLSRSRLAALEIPVPPKSEQEKIAAILWKLRRTIATQDRLIAATRDLKQSAMQRLFTHGLRGEPLKDTAIGMTPRNWRVDRLVELVHFQRGFDITKSQQKTGTVPVISSGGIKSWHSEVKVAGPGVVIGRKGSIGTVHYTESDYWPHDTTLWSTDFRGNFPLFVYYRLSVLDLARLDSGAANPALNRNFLHEEIVSWPENEEQRDIAAALVTIDRKLAHHQKKRAALNDLFQATLHQLMTAQIRVVDLDIDTSEVVDDVPEAGKVVGGQAGMANADHFVDLNKTIGKPERSRR